MNCPHDVEPTIEAIRHFAEQSRLKAKQLDDLADKMAATGDLTLAATAVNIATNPLGHMDWLVMRPLAALKK